MIASDLDGPGREGPGIDDWTNASVLDETTDDDTSWENEGRPVRVPATGPPRVPMLHLDGFDGPMDLLLDLVERQRIDLGQMSILALVEQFLAAFDQLRDRVAIERRADWLMMATRLVLLRSRLLFPESPEAAKAAEQEAASALRRLDELVAMRAAAAWLGEQPILGETVFTRGLPERTGLLLGTEHAVDVIAFLWASLALFEDDAPDPDTATRYRPSWSDLYSVTEAQDRILRLLGEGGDGKELERFLPEPPVAGKGEGGDDPLRLYAAWATTFSASLELAKQGDVTLAQADAFASVHVGRPIEPGP
jgi:segregation and condensation protein A